MMILMDISSGRRGAAIWRPVLNARRDKMTGTLEQVSGLLHEAGETHHQVFRIVDGADDDWASWYAQWLICHLPGPWDQGVATT
jgi:hypothetical protein